MLFKCPKCKYETDSKPSFKRHIFRELPCANNDISLESIRKEIVPDKTAFICKFCQKGFNSISGHFSHIARAHALTEESGEEKHKQRDFGHENTEYIADDFLRKMSYQPSSGVVELLRRIHFDTKHPENHNVRVVSKRDRIVERIIDGKWVKLPHHQLVNMLFWSAVRILQSVMMDATFIETHKRDGLDDAIAEEYIKLLGSSKANTMIKKAIFVMMTDETKNKPLPPAK